MSEELLQKIAELEAQLKQKESENIKLKKNCEPKKTPIKSKVSTKKKVEDYLFLYEMFLEVFNLSTWSELKTIYKRDENRKIHLDIENVNILSLQDIEESLEKVNDYETELKQRYKNELFEYTDYQLFSILFSELFLFFKDEILEFLQRNLNDKSKDICIVDDDFDIEDNVAVAKLFKKFTQKGEINSSFLKKIDEYRNNILTKDEYFKEVHKLAYYMATGSGKTIILHTNILQALYHFKDANFYVVVPTKELGKQHRKNLIEFGYGEKEIGFIDDDKSSNVSNLVNSMLMIPYNIKIITVHQLSAINKRKTIFDGINILFVDEGHKGQSSEAAWRIDRENLIGENGFAFEYSATFSHSIKEDTKLLQEYSKSIVFDYPYYKFYNDGYGKKPDFEPKESIDSIYKKINNNKEKLIDIEDNERYELFIQDLLTFYNQKLSYINLSQAEIQEYRFENPLKLIICSTVDDKNKTSKVVEVLNFLQKFTTDIEETKKIINIKKVKLNIKSKADKIYVDIFKYVFNSSDSGKIVEYKINDKEVGLKVENSKEFFGVVNVGNISNLGRDFDDDKIVGSLINNFFIKGDNPSINIVIAARILIEGWDTQRISSLSLFDFGKSKGSLIVQLFGRGVRLHGKKDNNLKRSGVYETLEEFSVYGYDATYLKTFIEESELGSIIKQKSITLKHKIVHEDKLNYLSILKSKNDFETDVLIYQFNKNEFSKINKKLQYNWSIDTHKIIEINIKSFLNIDKLYEDLSLKQKDNLLISFEEFIKSTDEIFKTNIKIKDSIKTSSFEMFYRIALKIINSYFDYWYKNELKIYQFDNVEYIALDKKDKNIDFKYIITADENIIDTLTNELNSTNGIYEIDLARMTQNNMFEFFNSKQLAIYNHDHIFNPLLIKHDELQISPDRLEESEVIFLQNLHSYWVKKNQKTNIVLLRNQQHIGFHGFYPDFIMWYREKDIEHFIFLDPKGINNFNATEVWDKISFSYEIKKIENKLNKTHKNLKLHSFILPTKSLEELANNDGIKQVLNNNITMKFGGKISSLNVAQIKEALEVLNVICVKDDNLIEQILQEIKKDDVVQIFDFVKNHLLEEDNLTKLDEFIKLFTDKDITSLCSFATNKEEAIVLYIYINIFNNELMFNEFCNSLKNNEVKSIKDDFKDKSMDEILTEIGMELVLDGIPFVRTGFKVGKYFKKIF